MKNINIDNCRNLFNLLTLNNVINDIIESEQIEEIGAVVDVDVFHCDSSFR